jgi:mxaJ protein
MRIIFSLLVCCAIAAGAPRSAHAQNGSAEPLRELRVCSDPNNLPYSNDREEGFENRIARLLADELRVPLRYHWYPQRRGLVRHSMREQHLCDVVMGIPSSYEILLPSNPYYRSTYVFLFRKDRGYQIRSFDDEILKSLKIGVHLVGDDYANTPPAHALGKRGVVHNVVGYSIYGDYSEPNPPARLIEAVARGDVDLAIVWGPLAGYFAREQGVEMEIVPVSPQIDLPFLPFVFDIAMGVRRTPDRARGEDDPAAESLKEAIDEVLTRKRADIQKILQDYSVPVIERGARRVSHR